MQLTINYRLTSIFTSIGIGMLLLVADFTAINGALSSIQRDFEASLFITQWVFYAYVLTFSVFLVIAGRLADLFGRKRLFLLGLSVFCLTSIWGALAPSVGMMILARASQGIGAAMVWPAILGICYFAVPEEKRSFAIGLLLGMAGFGLAAGLILGKVLPLYINWRVILWINVPLTLLAGVLAYIHLENEKRKEEDQQIDGWGGITLSLAVISFMIAMERAIAWGLLSWNTLCLIGIAVILLGVFYAVEKGKPFPVIPKDLLQNRLFLISAAILALISPAFFAVLVFLPQYMQNFLGFSPLISAIGSLPMLLIWALVSPVAGDLYNHLGAKLILMIATASVALGALLFGIVGVQSSYFFLLPGMIISGVGYGFAFSSLTTLGISANDETKASVAGGLLYLLQIVGGILGFVIGKEIFTAIASNERFHQAYAKGFLGLMIFHACLALAGTLLATFFLKKKTTDD